MLCIEVVERCFVSVRDGQPLDLGSDRRSKGSLVDLSSDSSGYIRSDGLNSRIMRDWHNKDVTTPGHVCCVRIVSCGLCGGDLPL